jgi:hypothetical protein
MFGSNAKHLESRLLVSRVVKEHGWDIWLSAVSSIHTESSRFAITWFSCMCTGIRDRHFKSTTSDNAFVAILVIFLCWSLWWCGCDYFVEIKSEKLTSIAACHSVAFGMPVGHTTHAMAAWSSTKIPAYFNIAFCGATCHEPGIGSVKDRFWACCGVVRLVERSISMRMPCTSWRVHQVQVFPLAAAVKKS